MNIPKSIESIIMDHKGFIETFMRVESKDRELVPFKLNHIQDMELAELSDMRRDQYVKPAQVGSTTLWAAVFLHDTMTHPSTTSVIVAHEEFITQRLLAKVQALYDNLPRQMKIPMHRSSAYEKTFPDIHSTFYIGSARAYMFGRGEPIHNFLGSEVAFWPDATKIMVPTMQRVPMSGTMILESTPNGEDGIGKYFHDNYIQGKEGRGIFKPHFYCWWEHDEYQIPAGSTMALPADRGLLTFTEDEADLVRLHDLTDDQIRWRRRKLKEFEQLHETGETRLLFQQEFPESDVTCWLAVGDAAYDATIIERLARGCYIPSGEHSSFNGAMVWYPPQEGHTYVCSIDPGMGKESKTVIHVWEFPYDDDDKETAIHCATVSGYFLSEVTAAKSMELAHHYNDALLAVETNPPGIPVAYQVQNYRNLYWREDIISHKRGRTIGWLTTPRTKPQMLSELTRMLPRLISHDINFIGQCRNMRYIGDRIMAVGPDDHHDAGAIAIVCRPSRSRRQSGFAGQAGWQDGW